MRTIGKTGGEVRFKTKKWYFDRDWVIELIGRERAERLMRAGLYVRQTMRRSIRKARRKRESELTELERAAYDSAVRRAKRKGLPKPRPWQLAHSRPGEPPRSITGLLRGRIDAAYDPRVGSAVVGPDKLDGTAGDVPAVLEYGGYTESRRAGRRVRIEPRPYARPALQKVQSKLPKLFQDLWT